MSLISFYILEHKCVKRSVCLFTLFFFASPCFFINISSHSPSLLVKSTQIAVGSRLSPWLTDRSACRGVDIFVTVETWLMMAGPIGAKPCDDQPSWPLKTSHRLITESDCVCEIDETAAIAIPCLPQPRMHTHPCPPSPAPQKTLLGTHTLMLHERKELRYHLELINLTYRRVCLTYIHTRTSCAWSGTRLLYKRNKAPVFFLNPDYRTGNVSLSRIYLYKSRRVY